MQHNYQAMKVTAVVATLAIIGVVAALVMGSTGDPYYPVDAMQDAAIHCDIQASMRGMDELACLRAELPEMSDDQLNRIDHLIEEAS